MSVALLISDMNHNTKQYIIIHYEHYTTIQKNIIQYNTIQYNTMQYNTIQGNVFQRNAIFHITIHYYPSQENNSVYIKTTKTKIVHHDKHLLFYEQIYIYCYTKGSITCKGSYGPWTRSWNSTYNFSVLCNVI